MRGIARHLVNTAAALLGGGIFYAIYLAIFIALINRVDPVGSVFLWTAGPVVTAMGFAAGLFIAIRRSRSRTPAFHRVFLAALGACSLFGALFFSQGPMLMVFGIFLGGILSVFLFSVFA